MMIKDQANHLSGSASFVTLKWIGWLALLSIFVCGFFFRFAPGTLALHIQEELKLTPTTLGFVASLHFWVYTLMQVPAGLVVDKIGLRRTGTVGGLLTGIGALVFAFASGLPELSIGTTMMGLGLSAVFVALMKYNVVWFSAGHHSLVMGFTMLLAAFGSILAESPAALALRWSTWRELVGFFATLTLISAGVAAWFCRDDPGSAGSSTAPREQMTSGYQAVLSSRQMWLLFLSVGGSNGTLYAFLGLWSVPLMVDSFGLQHTEAAGYSTASLVVYGFGSLFAGWLSEAIGARKPVIISAAMVSFVTWGVMAFTSWSPGAQAWILFLLLGYSGSQVAVLFSATRESAPIRNVGFAIAVVNMGAFFSAAIVQLGFGVVLDHTVPAGQNGQFVLADYQTALLVPLSFAAAGLIASLGLRETAKEHLK